MDKPCSCGTACGTGQGCCGGTCADLTTGKQVGAVNIPSVNTAVPMTFIHNGTQYIVFAAGIGGNTARLIALALPRK